MDRVVYRIEANISQLTAQLQTVQKHLAAQNQRMTDFGRNIETSVGGAFLRLKTILAAVGVTLGTREIFQTADSWRALKVQMDNVTNSAVASEYYLKQLYAQAIKTGVAYQENVQTFLTFARSAGNVGISAQRVMTFMQGLNTVATATGTSAHNLSLVMYQLGQSFSSGRLQGDEFRSMAEGAPGLMDLFSRAALKSGKSLRELAEAGKITPEWLITSIENAKSEIDSLASSAPASFGRAAGQIKAHFQELIRDLEKTGGFEPIYKPLEEFSRWLASADARDSVKNWSAGIGTAMQWVIKAGPGLKLLADITLGAGANPNLGRPAQGFTQMTEDFRKRQERRALETTLEAPPATMLEDNLNERLEAARRDVAEILGMAKAQLSALGVEVDRFPLEELGKVLLKFPDNADKVLTSLRDSYISRKARLENLTEGLPLQLADYIGLSPEGRAMAPATKLSIPLGAGPDMTTSNQLLEQYRQAIEVAYAELDASKAQFVEDVYRQYIDNNFGPTSFMQMTLDQFKSRMLSTDTVYDDPGLQGAIDAARNAVANRASAVEMAVEQLNDMVERIQLQMERIAGIGPLESPEGGNGAWETGPFAASVRAEQASRFAGLGIRSNFWVDDVSSIENELKKQRLGSPLKAAQTPEEKAAATKAEKIREHIEGLKEELAYQAKVTAATRNFGAGLEQVNVARKVQLELQQAGVKAGSAEAATIENLTKQKLEEERATELVIWRRKLELEQQEKQQQLSALNAMGAQQGYQAEFYRLQMDYNRRKGLPEGTGIPSDWLKDDKAKEMADIIAEPLKQAARVIQTSIATLVQGLLTGNFGGGGFFAQTDQFMMSAISNSVAGAVGSELTAAAGKIGENVAAWWSGKGGPTPLTAGSVGAMGAAGGYVLGSLGTAYAGMGANAGIGGSLGGSLGAMAGFGLAGPVGAAIGFGLGTVGGSLLGSFMSGSGGNNRAGSKYNLGMGLVLPGADLKSGSNQKLVNDLLTDLDSTRKFLASAGVSFAPSSLSIRAGDKSGFDLTSNGRAREFDSLSGLRKGMMQTLIESGTGFSESMTIVLESVKDRRAEFQQDALQFAVAFDEMTAPTESLVRSLTLLNSQFDQAKVKAEEYGLSVEAIEVARAKAIDDLLYDSETNLRGRVEAIKNVFEQLYGPLEDLVSSMDLGDMSVLSPVAQLAAAREAFRGLLPGATAGDQESIRALNEAAQSYLSEAREFGASSAIYQDIYREIQQVLGNVIAQGDQRLEAIMADVPTAIRDGARDTITELQRGFGDMIAAFNSLKAELVRRAVVA